MRSFVVGGAGFIGSHLVELLVDRGPVTVFDDLSVGRAAFLELASATGRVRLIEGDARDLDALAPHVADHDVVVHLSANPEARRGLVDTRLDLEQGTIATYNALEAARRAGVGKFVFASSGTVYGESEDACAEEDLGRLPISLYGASKLAGEAMVSAFAHCFDSCATIVRFGNVVGPRGTHGAALDFLRKLRDDPHELEVLGDGEQAKPYVHVTDCAAGILFALDHTTPPLEVFNLAPSDTTSVRQIAETCIRLSPYPDAVIRYTGGERGWRGDVARSKMRSDKLRERGFSLRHSSDEAMKRAVDELVAEVFPPRRRKGGG
ncbi:MAG: NAD-dependent epimerase/dehydratase family protein [Polyangiaceae bacterium]|nr:NAD-dependent epimerase/dehydratase family protein [Polyangiaceae bacterium]